jgi:hypothetical protein
VQPSPGCLSRGDPGTDRTAVTPSSCPVHSNAHRRLRKLLDLRLLRAATLPRGQSAS